tara:strand:- start:123216 stop:125030 length:1815 start_codon:yes stop_codon:yes gene_type:complete
MVELSSVVAGPVVRRALPDEVSIWLALQTPALVELHVEDVQGNALLTGQAETVKIGERLHLALVTASGSANLDWGQTYRYTLTIGGEPLNVEELLYEGGEPTLSFVLPGASLGDTHIVHGSCRHPSNPGEDAMAILDDMLAASFAGGDARPQIFVCSGDLVYADSPSPSLLATVSEVGERLLGYREVLPGGERALSELPLEERASLARDAAQIYDGRALQLFSFGEYLALHLLALSPSAWPSEPPDDVRKYWQSLPRVRRALANCAFYAVFDDHEITDDWYLTRAWSERVLNAPLGRRMIANGLAAFAIVHVWGNTPAQFDEGQPGARILAHLSTGQAPNSSVEPDLGIPLEVGAKLQPPSGALRWHFRLKTPVVDLRALDTRTMRAFPLEDEHGLPDLLSAEALVEQLSDIEGLPVIVAPAPFAPPPRTGTERFLIKTQAAWQGKSRLVRNVYGPDRGDDWQPKSEFFTKVLDALGARWVCLGGDTHLAYAAEVTTEQGRGAIFCSSGMQRESATRLMRQRIGFRYPWPWPGQPTVATSEMRMRYLRSELTSDGKRYEYFARNNIGRLRFELGDDLALYAIHQFCWRVRSAPVEHRISLHAKA